MSFTWEDKQARGDMIMLGMPPSSPLTVEGPLLRGACPVAGYRWSIDNRKHQSSPQAWPYSLEKYKARQRKVDAPKDRSAEAAINL